jgi:hypothetical protein
LNAAESSPRAFDRLCGKEEELQVRSFLHGTQTLQ